VGRLQTARLENFIRRWGSIKGEGSVLSETLGDVFPMLDLENLTPENLLPAGWSIVSKFGAVVGVTAQLSGLSILNPAGSGSIGVIDKIIILSEKDSTISFGTDIDLFTPFLNTINRDTRHSNNFNGNLRLGAEGDVQTAPGGGILTVLAGISRELEVPHGLAVLSPGGQFACTGSAQNNDLNVSFFGHERLAEPSELSF